MNISNTNWTLRCGAHQVVKTPKEDFTKNLLTKFKNNKHVINAYSTIYLKQKLRTTNCKQKLVLKNECIWKHITMYCQSYNIKNDLKNEKMEIDEMI